MYKIATLIMAGILMGMAPSVWAQEVNYDEARIPEYVLPDPMLMQSGKAVKSVKQWENRRRPELMKLFETEMFGKMPGRPDDMHYELLSEDPAALNGKATSKEVAVYFDSARTLSMTLLMYVPNGADGPVPAFLGANFKGNAGTLGENARRWPFEYIVSEGYAVVTFAREDVDPDHHDGFKLSLIHI